MRKPFQISFYKNYYKPRFRGYFVARAFIQTLDAVLGLIASFFGYESELYGNFCDWNLDNDMKRRIKDREAFLLNS